MLVVYTYHRERPPKSIDLSIIPLQDLATNIQSIVQHHEKADIWFGYLEGWMLSPQEEVLIRKAIRKFTCHVVSFFPLSFSQSWKNEILSIYTTDLNGRSNTHDNGCIIHDGEAIGYGGIGS